MRLILACLFLLFVQAVPAAAADPSPAFRSRAAQLVQLLNERGRADDLFASQLLDEVPPRRVANLARQLRSQYGAPGSVVRIDAVTAEIGTVFVAFERAIVRIEMVVDAVSPHRIKGFVIADAEVAGDSLTAVLRDIWALPGEASVTVAKLDGNPAFSVAYRAEQPMAVASAFKLFILAELCRSIGAGERKWTDVVPLHRQSIPNGLLQDWPEGSPLTLYTLAGFMISRSDNSASDTLLHLLGREKVEALLPALGVRDPDRLRPLLDTREAAMIKAGEDSTLAARWASAGAAERRAILRRIADIPPEKINVRRLNGRPIAVQTVEWFASTADLVRVLDWLRANGGKEALDLLAINPGVFPRPVSDFAYFGYKGGSESGVLNFTFLVRSKDGVWRALSATWNNPAMAVDEARFTFLMRRALALMRGG